MNVLAAVIVAVLLLLAAVLGATGILAMIGRLPGNGVLGVRTPETRRSAEAWRAANRTAGPAFLGSGAVLLLGAASLALIGGWIGGIVVILGVAAAIVLLNVAGLAGARAAAMWQEGHAEPEGPGCCGGAGETSDSPACGTSSSADSPAADCGAGADCGSCALSGLCTTEHSAG